MPIYEYSCTDCGHELEIMQKMNDLPLAQCPACGQNTLRKLISASAFHLKGTGWYKSSSQDKVEKTETPAPACGAGTCCACADAAA
jgi:putative FmdB family regulatory protein